MLLNENWPILQANWAKLEAHKEKKPDFVFFSFCKKCEVGVNDAGRPGLGANSPKNSNLFSAAQFSQ